ncbi:MAG: glucose-6-phosphate dehydrogenase, partial [Planktomarina sp.]|nr:glucose-6-phosphate dehydrogenase [Planktomarina sp.]
MVSRVIPVDSFDLIIFGGTGDLARRKILPGLFRRFCSGQMPSNARIIGAARADLGQAVYQDNIRDAINEFGEVKDFENAQLETFLVQLDYVAVDVCGDGGWAELAALVRKDLVNAYYFSVAPGLFGDIASRLNTWGLATPESRIVVEKPFGRDLD